jgi:hypothetical protein
MIVRGAKKFEAKRAVLSQPLIPKNITSPSAPRTMPIFPTPFVKLAALFLVSCPY